MQKPDTAIGPSFSLKNRVLRVIWNFTSLIFFRFSPSPFYKWRAFLLKMFGAKVGEGAHVYPGVKIWAPWNLDLGKQCGIANGVTLYSQGKITIGCRAVISQGAYICAGTHDYTQPGFPLITKPIIVHDHVWIAAEAFIHPGTTINPGCVIGARAVVTRDMPAWMVCAGNPCKPLKQRVNEEVKSTFYPCN
jgi:putative colanic acid biosynthesis acetyltransferase WcaF